MAVWLGNKSMDGEDCKLILIGETPPAIDNIEKEKSEKATGINRRNLLFIMKGSSLDYKSRLETNLVRV